MTQNYEIEKKESILHQVFPWLFLLGGYTATVLSFAFSGRRLILADDCTEWILADHLLKNGEIVSDSWNYGTELHVFFTQVVNRDLLKLFSDWHQARTVSFALFLLLLVLCVLFVSSQMQLKRYGAYAAGALAIPFGARYAYFGLFSGFYTFYIALAFLMVGLIMRIMNRKGIVERGWMILCLGILSFLSGLNGIRMLIIVFAPTLLTAAVFLWIEMAKEDNTIRGLLVSRAGGFFLLVLLETVICAAGWRINETFLAGRFTFWTYSNNNLSTFRFSEFIDYLDSFVYLLGYEGIQNFFNYAGAGQLCALILCILVVGAFIFCLCHKERLTDVQLGYVVFAMLAYLSNTMLFYLGQQAEDRFLIPSLCYAFPVFALALHIAAEKRQYYRRSLAALAFAACLFVQGMAGTYVSTLIFDRGRVTPEQNLAGWLEQEGYTQGMASFWNSAELTYLSSGRIEMWSLNSSPETPEDDFEVFAWEQAKAHDLALPEGRAFLVVTEKDGSQFDWCTQQLEPVYDADGFRVYELELENGALKDN